MAVRGDTRKYDGGKPAMDLVPLSAVEAAGYVLTYGAATYAPNSWQEVDDRDSRYLAAMLRHLAAIERGELYDIDDEEHKGSGLLHVAHVSCLCRS